MIGFVGVNRNWQIIDTNNFIYYKDAYKFLQFQTQYNIILTDDYFFYNVLSKILTDDNCYIVIGNNIPNINKIQQDNIIYCNNFSQTFLTLQKLFEDTSFTTDNIICWGTDEFYNNIIPYCTDILVAMFDQYHYNNIMGQFFNLDKNIDWKCGKIQISNNDPITLYQYYRFGYPKKFL